MSNEVKIAIVIAILTIVFVQLVLFWRSDEYKIKKITEPKRKLDDVRDILITKRITAKSDADIERAKILIDALTDLSDEISDFMIDGETRLYKSKNYSKQLSSKKQVNDQLIAKDIHTQNIEIEVAAISKSD